MAIFAVLLAGSLSPIAWTGALDEGVPAIFAWAAGVVAAAIVLRAAGSMVPPYRRPWRLIAASLTVAAVMQATEVLDERGLRLVPGWVTIVLPLLAGGFALGGLLGLSGRLAPKARLVTLSLEAAITGLSGLVVAWLVVAPRAAPAGSRPSYSPLVLTMISAVLVSMVLLRLTRVPRTWFGPMFMFMIGGTLSLSASLFAATALVPLAAPSAIYVVAFGAVAIAPLGGTWNALDLAVEPLLVQRFLPYLAAIAATLALFIDRVLTGTTPQSVRGLAAGIALALAARQLVAAVDDKLHAEKLLHEATHDSLTQLPNRAVLMERLELVLQRAADEGRTHALLFLDLDDFKAVNDGISHAVGDKLLQSVAARLRAAVRPTDLVVRLSGDEFALLLENRRLADVRAISRRLLKIVHQPHRMDRHELRLSGSIGVAIAGVDDSPNSMLSKADAAMYAAKRAGKNGCRVFDEQMQAQALADLNLLQDLDFAVAHEDLKLVYQPILSLGSGQFFAAEALLRWRRPGQGWVSIGSSMHTLEGSRLLTTIDDWVLREACRQLKRWRDQGWAARVGINVSAAEIGSGTYPRRFARVLEEERVQPGWIVVEVTEGMALSSKAGRTVLEDLRALGVRVSIDDFGTAYSSLRRLREFAFDSLKIDASFVSDESDRGRSLLEAIVAVGKSVDVTVIAEGIESAEQIELLRSFGCHLGQGYHLCPPVSADSMERKFVDVGIETPRPLRITPSTRIGSVA